MQYHAIQCNTMQNHAIPCKTMPYHAIPCNTMQYYAIQCNTMQYHASLITADGAYHCPLGSIWPFFKECIEIIQDNSWGWSYGRQEDLDNNYEALTTFVLNCKSFVPCSISGTGNSQSRFTGGKIECEVKMSNRLIYMQVYS